MKKVIVLIVFLTLFDIAFFTFSINKVKILRANIIYGTSKKCDGRDVSVTCDMTEHRCHLCFNKFTGSSSSKLCYDCSEITGRCDVCGKIRGEEYYKLFE